MKQRVEIPMDNKVSSSVTLEFLAETANTIMYIEQELDILTSRLSLVLSDPSPPTTSAEAPRRSPECSLHAEIDTLNLRLLDVLSRIGRISNRVVL